MDGDAWYYSSLFANELAFVIAGLLAFKRINIFVPTLTHIPLVHSSDLPSIWDRPGPGVHQVGKGLLADPQGVEAVADLEGHQAVDLEAGKEMRCKISWRKETSG